MANEPTAKQVDERVGHKRAEFLSRAGQAFDRMFGADGQNGLVTFAEREDRACEVGDELTRWLMAEHLALDPTGGTSVERDCPICGGPVRYESSGQAEQELREFQTRRGKIQYRRAAARCPRCRKIFFPAGRAFGSGDGGLQRGLAGQDRIRGGQ
jgi:hypothetical protein